MYFLNYNGYILPIEHKTIEDGSIVAHSYYVRATATGENIVQAINNLKEAIDVMVAKSGFERTFEDY